MAKHSTAMALKTTPANYTKCLEYLRKMTWHLSFTPDANKFSVIAYRSALESLQAHGTLEGIGNVKGIGKSIMEGFEKVCSNKVPENLRNISMNGPPYTVHELTRIAGVGEKTAAKLYTTHGIKSLGDLDKAIKAHKITDPKLIGAYLDMGAVDERMPRTVIEDHVQPIIDRIREIASQETEVPVEHVGSFRRHRADIRDIDILVGTTDTKIIKAVTQAMKKFADKVNLVDKSGSCKCEVQITFVGRQRKLDIYFVDVKCWGSALMHFTGPEKYNILIRKRAKQAKLKVSQYGVTNLKTGKIKRFVTEQSMCEYLGIPWLEPELRDLFPGFKDVKPNEKEALIVPDSVKCDLHVHSTESDGKASFSDIVRWHKKSNHKYLCISNHSKGTGNGMDDARLLRWLEATKKKYSGHTKQVNGKTKKLRLLFGAETDIKIDGGLGYGDATLKALDYVILAIHHNHDTNATKRLLSGIAHVVRLGVPAFIAHPTNRIIGYRSGSTVDWPTVIAKCVEHNIPLEINGQGDRCDAPDSLIQVAKNIGCKFMVSSDFHGTTYEGKQKLITQAVMQARRGWLTCDDVVNCNSQLLKQWLGI